MIVDDTKHNVDFLETTCEFWGLDTISFRDGAKALDYLNKKPVDLIILDLIMPGLDGFEFLRKYNSAVYNKAPILAVSASVFDKDVQRAKTLGAIRFLPKPIYLFDLAQTLSEILEVELVEIKGQSQSINTLELNDSKIDTQEIKLLKTIHDFALVGNFKAIKEVIISSTQENRRKEEPFKTIIRHLNDYQMGAISKTINTILENDATKGRYHSSRR
jgi:CheY-like chemotaxis protein